jgi:exodeoxyribonuclease V alpha subunit
MDARDDNQIELSGVIDAVIYASEENDYTVLRMETQDGDQVTVVGCLPFAAPGEALTVRGTWTRHQTHGAQFRAEWAQRTMPRSADAIYEYLAGRAVKGIGPATAMLIVSRFGDAALDVLENEPEKLAGIRGISLKKAQEISESFRRQMGLRRLMEFLYAHELKPQLAMRLYRYYGDRAMGMLRDNPYILAHDHIGGAFSDADTLALELGFEGDSPQRIMAAVSFELSHNAGNGHTFIPRDKLVAATAQLIDVDQDSVEEGVDTLLETGDVVCETIAGREGCYLARLYEAETYTARRIGEMAVQTRSDKVDITSLIAEVERRTGLTYAPLQRRTLEIAATRQIMVITGGPGTGKTTSVRAILALFDRLGLETVLTAPTGRAAKRMAELSGKDAQTIHRLLEAGWSQTTEEMIFRRGEEEPLECDAVILDECSMVDITLIRALLAAMPPDCRLVLVGDADQLPSVGPGNVFSDIIRSGAVETVRLTEIFRQTADSRIVRCAHQINQGEHPNLAENKGDLFFLRRRDAGAAVDTVVELCEKRLPGKMGIPPQDIQVLTPSRRQEAGTAALNRRLQAALNPPAAGKNEKIFGEITFREGDRVMQIKNNYDIIWKKADNSESGSGVFNGDIGQVIAIDATEETLTVDYEDRIATYSFDMLGELEHAFAMTVHKSQGSEYRAVVLAITRSAPQLLHRGVLYTAVTRARELLIIVGDDEAVGHMIDNHKQTRRYSGLRARLAGA